MSTQMRAQIDKQLTNVSQKLVVEGCVSPIVLPKVQSAQYSGKIAKYGLDHLRIVNSVIGGKGKYRRVESVSRSSDGFYIESHGLEGLVTDEDYKNVEDPFDAESDETEGITSILMLEKEKALADSLTSTSVLTQNVTLSGTSQFSDYSNSDPLAAIVAGKKAVRDGCGGIVNAMIMDYDVAEVLRYHPAILDRLGFKEQKPGGLTDADLAKAFNIERLIIPSAKYNSAALGQADVLANIWGKHIVMACLPVKSQKNQISLGYEVQLSSNVGWKVKKRPVDNPDGATEIIISGKYDQVITKASAGYLLKDVIA
jgi:hypothetical protein